MDLVTTAAAAKARYDEFLHDGRLIQAGWHSTDKDGRQLACALGVLGDDVEGARACPASIMPRWLAQMVPAFFDRQRFDDAKDWGARFYAELARLNGEVPFSVVHDWHANTTTVLGIEAATKRERDTAPHVALQELHKRALAGEKIGADEWRPVLRNAYAYADADADAYADAYADADADAYADAYAYANANAYAYANAYANANANAYAYAYANANANAYAYAYANANANADANADANANANADANAYAYAYAYAYANADAYANAYAYAWKRLADGMVEALSRVPTPVAEAA